MCGAGEHVATRGNTVFLRPVGVCTREQVVIDDGSGSTAGRRIDGGIDRAVQHDLEALVVLDNAVLDDGYRHDKAGLPGRNGNRVREYVIAIGKVRRKSVGRASRCGDANNRVGHLHIDVKNLVEENYKVNDP